MIKAKALVKKKKKKPIENTCHITQNFHIPHGMKSPGTCQKIAAPTTFSYDF